MLLFIKNVIIVKTGIEAIFKSRKYTIFEVFESKERSEEGRLNSDPIQMENNYLSLVIFILQL